jgi:hypothetical protein
MFQPYSTDKRKFMEYLEFHGTFTDIPVEEIVCAFEKTYGRERVQGWIEDFEKYGNVRKGRFDREDIVRE